MVDLVGDLHVGVLMALLASPIFWTAYPMSLFAFCYFGVVRDESGNLRHR